MDLLRVIRDTQDISWLGKPLMKGGKIKELRTSCKLKIRPDNKVAWRAKFPSAIRRQDGKVVKRAVFYESRTEEDFLRVWGDSSKGKLVTIHDPLIVTVSEVVQVPYPDGKVIFEFTLTCNNFADNLQQETFSYAFDYDGNPLYRFRQRKAIQRKSGLKMISFQSMETPFYC